MVRISARYTGPISCPHCGAAGLRVKERRVRQLRHESWGLRHSVVELETRKWRCRECGRTFWQRFPGILPRKRSTEPFRRSIFLKHWDGISRRRLGQREKIGSATVERWFQDFLRREAAQQSGAPCPQVLGIDEHFFSRRHGYATTFCDLKNRKVFDVVLGRSEASLEKYLERLAGKHLVRVVCMDLASVYRALVRKHFPNARIVADRFHVIRLINHHFLACWREIDPTGAKNRGLLSLMRRHRHNLKPEQRTRLAAYWTQQPTLEPIYRFKQRLSYLLLKKHKPANNARGWRPAFSVPSLNCARRDSRIWFSSEKPCSPGPRRLLLCGASPAIMALPKVSTPKWRSCNGKPTASATSKTIDSELGYCVLEISRKWGCPH